MRNLPINAILSDIKETFKTKSTLIVQAPPGAGKSTVVPLSLLGELWLGDKIIIMLEPRRMAARMVATQMARFLGEEVGQSIGYAVKMDTCTSKSTKILVVTEAILVRKLQGNQALDDVALIIFDEFHERSIHTDLSLALSLQVQEVLRDDLKILIMSATLNSTELTTLLGDVPVITSQGKMYEVEVEYLPVNIGQPTFKTITSLLLNTILKSLREDKGDILVFLAGAREIRALQKGLEEKLNDNDILVCPLYSALPKKEQDRAITKEGKRKIILATNIAQTSLTIEGVGVVVDSGFEKLSRYNHANGMNHLELSFISQDSATQRAGRAGRLSRGKCYKLWHHTKILQESTKPEILRADLSSVMLDLALWGVDDFSDLKWLDIPSEQTLNNTKEVLAELMMLDDSFVITQWGRDALSLGLHPRFAYMILRANELGYAYEACLLAALLSEKDIFKNTMRDSDVLSRFIHLSEKDFESSYINRFAVKEVLSAAEFSYKKLKGIKKVTKVTRKFSKQMVAVLLLYAYPDRLAKQRGKGDARYKLSNGKGAILHLEDALYGEEFLVVPSLHAHDKDSTIHLACSITLELIEEYFSLHVRDEMSMKYNKQSKKFEGRENTYFLSLQLSSRPSAHIDKKYLKKLLIKLIFEEGLELLTWSKKATQLRERVNFTNAHMSSTLPDFSDTNLLATLSSWLEPYLQNISTVKELENLDIYHILLSQISWENQKLLEALVPQSITVPSGSNINIDYSNQKIPILAVKIQEMFGLSETPSILNKTLPLQIHLLSPAKRPIQITYDLKSFWENSYAEVRKELRGIYKRHYWPENPLEAIATSKTKKKMNL